MFVPCQVVQISKMSLGLIPHNLRLCWRISVQFVNLGLQNLKRARHPGRIYLSFFIHISIIYLCCTPTFYTTSLLLLLFRSYLDNDFTNFAQFFPPEFGKGLTNESVIRRRSSPVLFLIFSWVSETITTNPNHRTDLFSSVPSNRA